MGGGEDGEVGAQTGTEPTPGGLPADLSQPAVRGLAVTCRVVARWFVHLATVANIWTGVRKGGSARGAEGQGTASPARRL